jgi:addiction module RelE/StbE family toxin
VSVVWRAAATADLTRIFSYISEHNPLAARRVARELISLGDTLATFPRRGRVGKIKGTRELLATWPYILVYEVDDAEDVQILRIWHKAQDRI